MAKSGTMIKTATINSGTGLTKYIMTYELDSNGKAIFGDRWYTENEWKQLKRAEKLRKISEDE